MRAMMRATTGAIALPALKHPVVASTVSGKASAELGYWSPRVTQAPPEPRGSLSLLHEL